MQSLRSILGLSLALFLSASAFADSAADIIKATGVKGGFVVHLGCGDGELTTALRVNKGYLVHGLGTDVTKARAAIRKAGLYGPVSADRLAGSKLPYIDGSVNLLITEDLQGVPMTEVMRVLTPKGVAYVKQGDDWKKTVKPRPDNIDDWTHFLHDSGVSGA